MKAMGEAIRNGRLRRAKALRKFALEIGISAAHQSDIERGRRMPSTLIMEHTAYALRDHGVTFDGLDALDTRIDDDVKEWISITPAVRQLLRALYDAGWTGGV